MNRRFHYRTRTWLQLGMIPALALATIAMAFNLHRALRDIILRSVEQKLTAVSTVTSQAVRFEDHQWLMSHPSIVGLAYHGAHDAFYAIHRAAKDAPAELLRIRAANGLREYFTRPLDARFTDLGCAPGSDRLFALDPGRGDIVEIEPIEGTVTPFVSLGQVAHRLAVDDAGALFTFTDRLVRIDLATKAVQPVGRAQPAPRALVWNPTEKTLWAVSPGGAELSAIDRSTGASRRVISFEPGREFPLAFAFDARRDRLVGAHRALQHFVTKKGAAEAPYLAAYGKELSVIYRQYALPMRRIMQELDLTYVYTQVVANGGSILYGIDGTQAVSHSALQSSDQLPEEAVPGIVGIAHGDRLYVTPVIKWAGWDYLKSAYVPIMDNRGAPVALAGTDIDNATIESQTHRAEIQLLAVSSVTLVLASAVSLWLARGLQRPLRQIKATALQIAAGNYAQRITVENPREARELGQNFNQAAAALERGFNALQSSLHDLLQKHDRNDLARHLARRNDPAEVLAGAGGIAVAWRSAERAALSPSGAARHAGRAVIWFAAPAADPFAAARRRAELGARFSARVQTAIAVPLPGDAQAAVSLDLETRIVRVLRRDSGLTLTSPDDRIEITDGALELTLHGFRLEDETP